jgi:thioredoxin
MKLLFHFLIFNFKRLTIRISYLASFGIFLLVISCSEAQSQKHIKNVSAAEFKKEIENNPNVIVLDVRTPEEVAQGTIGNPSIINFYDSDFEKKISLMDKSKTIAVYCKGGGRSSQAAMLLEKNGFKNILNLEGGIMSWEQQGFSVNKPLNESDNKIRQLSSADFNKLINSSQVVLIDFHTKWCAPCRKMAPIVDEIEKEFKGKAAVNRVDCDESKEVVKNLNISGVPVFIIFKNGKEVWRKNGAMAKEELVRALNSFL